MRDYKLGLESYQLEFDSFRDTYIIVLEILSFICAVIATFMNVLWYIKLLDNT